MPNIPSWLTGHSASAPVPGSGPGPPNTFYPRPTDPNVPDHRLQLTSRCIYERQLPGGSYITAHVERLQSGYYDSPGIHDDLIADVRFLAIRFVFHEASTERRFKSAVIRLSLCDMNQRHEGITPLPPQINHPANEHPQPETARQKPKFLRHAPHLLYGAMSPETLDWNFNLAGSLGVAQAPVSASINPSGGVKSSYKIYKMMKIQGSIRTNTTWFGKHYDIEDGELVWTLEENSLQKSGLPREFTFVMMLTKGAKENDVHFEIDIEPEVASWFGSYPQWWVHVIRYQPLYKEPLDLDKDIGQIFTPCDPKAGFNFAGLMSTFDDFVTLPGTLYSTQDWSADKGASTSSNNNANQSGKQPTQASNLTQSPKPVDGDDQATPSNTLHLRIHVDSSNGRGTSISAKRPSPEASSRLRKLTPPATPSPPISSKAESTAKPAEGKGSSKPAKPQTRVTIDTAKKAPTPPKYKIPRVTPLQTHYEEPQHPLSRELLPAEDELDQDYYSFPESLLPPTGLSSLPAIKKPNHHHSKSASTTSSAAAAGYNITAGPDVGEETALTSHPLLRRTRSRSGLRRASLQSEPEDEEAIAAAMDMLSGSPPPLVSSAPRSTSSISATTMIPTDDIILATPRTRATLADRMEVERSENARIARRNGNLNTDSSRTAREHSAGPVLSSTAAPSIPSRSPERDKEHERQRIREKRYSMPVTSTGIGYPRAGGSFNVRTNGGTVGAGGHVDRQHSQRIDTGRPVGNGRSSLMIPVGKKHDHGLGIGVVTTTTTEY